MVKKDFDFPYHALVEMSVREGTLHIPLPFFNEGERRQEFVLGLSVSEEIRDDEFFHCPFCGEASFYAGPCQECCLPEDDAPEEWVRNMEFENHEALKRLVKEGFLYRLDSELPFGIKSARIVLADRDHNENWNLPCAIDGQTQGDVVSAVWYKLDEWIAEGKIPPFTRVGDELFLIEKHNEFRDIISELERELGFRIPTYGLPFRIGEEHRFFRCQRCSSVEYERTIQLINGPRICRACARADPESTIEALGEITFHQGIIDTTDKVVDPDTLETFTEFREVSDEEFSEAKGHVLCLMVRDKEFSNNMRLFVWSYDAVGDGIIGKRKRIKEEEAKNNEDDFFFEPEIITVEGSEEIRRQVNGVWQHKHENYDYWHPMARVHKETT